MNKSEKVREPISSYDTEKLKEYFDKHLPNPADSISFKLTMLFDRLLEHKLFLVRWISIPFAFIFVLGLVFYEWARWKIIGRRYW